MSEPIIIALSGHKGSGKNTLATFIVKYFEDPEYFVDPECSEVCLEWVCGYGCMVAKEFAFADGIKDFCIDILGLEHKQCYGSDEDKNTPTKYKWEDTPHFLHSGATFPREATFTQRGFMTGREVMQIFGTECVRTWFGNVWVGATVRKIRKKAPELAIITDNRFPNEVEIILGQPKGYIIRLTRSPFAGSDLHPSETALDDFDWGRSNCFVLDNARMNKDEQNDAVIPILQKIFQGSANEPTR
ncbi:hypothetical protein LCGC14_2510680 [marine sediment metagenome]|uniref:Deoxynucleoside monophosphate kinase n=1 Tax=marine sediment metagenome TaxID=412755 RepID=A0A0F9BM43_9ZZZZ